MSSRFILSALVVASALVLLAGPALAREITVEDFHAAIEVGADGTVRVDERIRIRFQGPWNGIYREIPYGYTYAGGVRGQVRLELEAVTGADGTPLEHWTERTQGHLSIKIRVPGAIDATREIRVRYRARGVVRRQDYGDLDFGIQDEFYWNVTGNEWEMAVEAASAEIRLPGTIPAGSVRAKAFTGRTGGRGEDATIEVAGGAPAEAAGPGAAPGGLPGGSVEAPPGPVVRVRTTKPLWAGEGLTVAVIFPPGHVAQPGWWERTWWWLAANGYLFAPLALVLLWLLAWWKKGRDPLAGRTVIPEWDPPAGLGAAEAGVLLDDSFDRRDLTAAILDLAVKRLLTLRPVEGDDFEVVFHRDRLGSTSLEGYERTLLDGLFATDGTSVRLSALKYKFVTSLAKVQDQVLDALVADGHFAERPDKAMARWQGLSVLALIGLVVLGFVMGAPWPYWAASAVAMVILFVVARHMPRRTAKGLDTLARVRGIEEYVLTAEKERLKGLPLGAVERLLPYATALGIEERWAGAFASLFAKPPEWMEAREGQTGSADFARTLRTLGWQVQSSLLAVPRAASSSSSSSRRSGWGGGWKGGGGFSRGGGFSGGGFGGGGGRGW